MAIPAGTYRFGPENATLSLNTGRIGKVARAGHDLLIHVTVWEATLAVADDPAGSRIEVTADGASMQVIDGTGRHEGARRRRQGEHRPDDRRGGAHEAGVTFRSTRVEPAGEGLHAVGDLTLLGHTRPLAFDVSLAGDGTVSAVAVVKQTDFGMKPYSALFGALKVADEVRVSLSAKLPQSL